MYIIKNAVKCIFRSKGRNLLIGLIVFCIALSACLGLSIRQASENAKEETLKDINITANISFDRQSMMNDMMSKPSEDGGEPPSFDKDSFRDMMGQREDLTIDEYIKYSKASTVEDFYYQTTASLDGSDKLEPVSSESNETEQPQMPDNMGGGMFDKSGMGNRKMMSSADFSVVGYSGENAMISFINGNASVIEGCVFANDNECIITEELALYNDIEVGDKITLTNPNNEDQTYKLFVSGIYEDTSSNENSFSIMGSTSIDTANRILTSYDTIQNMIDKSSEDSKTLTDENTGREYSTTIMGMTSATYVFASVDDYNTFEEEVRELGLDEAYTVSSQDITQFENSLIPLETLSKTAGYFLIVILIIGGIILVVINIFSVRERKYEIGVLTAMGMKKGKVALQFIIETFIVTIISVVLAVGIGGVSSVPVTNALLENQVASSTQREEDVEKNFGRGPMGNEDATPPNDNGGFGKNMFSPNTDNYITEITSAMDLTVTLQMLGIALILTVVAGGASILFVMRYDPLKILSNRD